MTAHTIAAPEAGARCDVAIARLSGASRGAVALAIRAGDVKLNGAVPKPAMPVAEGDVLEYAIATPLALEARPEDIALDVVYEDDALLVVDKPAGMVTHPAHGARDGTLVNALLAHAGSLPGDPLRAGLVHRLDRDTSGLLVVAKTAEALSLLGKAMMRRGIERTYRGLVTGTPEHKKGTIDGALGRDPHNRLRYALRADGKPAVTHYELREQLREASELVFTLETGRTHQIRVHMAALGHPIVNDPVYGRVDPRFDLPGQALHAWRLAFRHPLTHEALAFEAPPPLDYLAALEVLRGG
ncbi:MAG: RluA family pseudouridine synthase [Candidatus Eremiobacteraeota bacterium]|nr:RluA family pseudouridine synthase [Candidatus Eremiobacteraeota bacterium]